MALAPGVAAAQTGDLSKPHSSLEIVLDSSKAMGRTRLAAARGSIVQAVHGLPAGTPVGLRLYGGGNGSCSDSRGTVPVSAADSSAMRAALKGVKPVGAAPLSLGVARAAKDLPAAGERTVVLIAGGPDSCAPPPSACQTATAASLRVDVIGVEVNAAGRRALQCTARASGGVYRDAATPTALGPELQAALARSTRDRRSLGKPVAGGVEQSQATPVSTGEYLDSISPDSERWYRVQVPPGHLLTAAATLVAPPTGDVSAPGSSLTVDAFGHGVRTNTASNLFAFDPSRTVTVNVSAKSGNSVRVSLHDSPDKQLAQKLHGRALALELLFRLPPAPPARAPARRTLARASTGDVSWGAAIAAGVACALIAFATAGFARRPVKAEDKS